MGSVEADRRYQMKPATSLPWSIEQIGVTNMGPDGEDVFDIGPCDREGAMHKRISTVAGYSDAAYLVHAANAYPKLVELVRYLAAHPGDLAQVDRAEALLRELGELS